MFKPSRVLALGGFLLITACFEIDLTGLNDVCLMDCPFTPGQAQFALTPLSERIVRGDTLSFYTHQCAEWFCDTDGNVNSRWSIEGDAAAASEASGPLTKSIASAPRILLHGVTVGRSTIRAVATGDSTRVGTAELSVVDSSSIVGMRLVSIGASPPDSLGLSGQVWIIAELRDANGTLRTQPGDWSISDTTVAGLSVARIFGGGKGFRLVDPKKPGTLEVTARFGDLSAKMLITVIQ